MPSTQTVICDGCGQPASPRHIARRLQRLEWTTRFRPVHIGALLLSAVSPENDAAFLYAPAEQHTGEAQLLLEAAGVSAKGKTFETVLSEFQRGGFFLAHVLECPLEPATPASVHELIEGRLPAAMTRIRRSLKPKRLVPISAALTPALPSLQAGNLGCTMLLDQMQPFALEDGDAVVTRLRDSLRSPSAASLAPG